MTFCLAAALDFWLKLTGVQFLLEEINRFKYFFKLKDKITNTFSILLLSNGYNGASMAP